MNTLNDFLASIKEVKFFSGAGELPDGCLLFDSIEKVTVEAETENVSQSIRFHAAIRASIGATPQKDWGATWNAARDAMRVVQVEATWDAALVAVCLLAWNDPTEVNTAYALRRWSVWTAGFGLLCDIKGTLYCYRGVA